MKIIYLLVTATALIGYMEIVMGFKFHVLEGNFFVNILKLFGFWILVVIYGRLL